MDEVEERGKRAAQSILENESLTEDLDDATGSVLLAWGIASAQSIAADTAHWGEDEATQAIDERLRSLRRMLKAVSRWLQAQTRGDAEMAVDALKRVIELAGLVYGTSFTAPSAEACASLSSPSDSPAALLTRLRALIEPPQEKP